MREMEMHKQKIITVIGARPQIIKSSAISRTIDAYFQGTLQEIVVHTGQHYDANMSDVFFKELELPEPKYNLHVGSRTHGQQTAQMLEGLEEIFIQEKPDAVLVYGDTNSTLSAALASAKLHIPLIHVEAGLRSFDKTMPEEINRIVCDHLSTLLFAPTTRAVQNLKNEGLLSKNNDSNSINHPKIYYCGDVMYDNSLYFSTLSDKKQSICEKKQLSANEFILCTVHRVANTDNLDRLCAILETLISIQEQSHQKIVFPIHPRTQKKLDKINISQRLLANKSLIFTEPLGFLDMIALEKNASMVITDSGGVQKEAFFFKKPCIILRSETEWVEIVENGNAQLTDADPLKIVEAYRYLSNKKDYTYPSFYGDGKTAKFICEQIVNFLR